MGILHGIGKWPRWAAWATGMAGIAGVAWLDYVTGPELSLSILYLIPVSALAWSRGKGAAVLMSVFAAAAWLGVDLLSAHSNAIIPCWNAGVRLGFFLIVSLLLVRRKTLVDALEKAVKARTAQLEAEIRDREQALEALRKSEFLYTSLVENLPQKIFIKDRNSVYVSCNGNYAHDLGIQPDEIVGRTDYDFYPRDLAEKYRADDTRIMESGGTEEMEEKYIQRGRELWVRTVKMPVSDRTGKVIGVLGIFRDVTEQRRMQEALHESEKRYRDLFENANDAIFIADAETGVLLHANREAQRLTGRSRDEIIGMHQGQLHPSGQAERYKETFRRHVRLGAAADFDGEVVMKDGAVVPVYISANVMELDGKKVIQSIFRDMTEHKKAEDAWRKSEERFKKLVESVTDYIYSVRIENGQTVETAHGPGCVTVTGYTAEEYRANPEIWFRMVPEEDRQAVIKHACNLAAGQAVRPLEHRIVHKDGRIRWVRNTPVPLRDDQGNLLGYEGLIQDITEHKKMEAQLLQSQKMEAVGQLAGGVAHDFRNQLTVIKGYAEMLLRHALVTEKGREHVGEILRAVERSASLSNELLTFSRKQVLRPEIVNLNDLIADMGKPLSTMIGEDIRLSIIPRCSLASIEVDVGHLRQAITNLVLNARDAMPKGGQLTIETANVSLDAPYVQQHAEASAGPHVLLAVSDTGVGMDKATLDRIFDPFFTTKPVGQGTGLGLPMVYGFVKQSGGDIAVYSEPGRGTTVKIYLPGIPAAAEPAGQPALPVGLRHGSGTILVVEDEEAIRNLIVQTLRECGYAVLETGVPQEALRLIQDYASRVDLLVTDVVMPGMDGADLAGRMRAVRPELKVLYISGYTGKALSRRGVVDDAVNLLLKPFSSQALTERVQQLLAREGGESSEA